MISGVGERDANGIHDACRHHTRYCKTGPETAKQRLKRTMHAKEKESKGVTMEAGGPAQGVQKECQQSEGATQVDSSAETSRLLL